MCGIAGIYNFRHIDDTFRQKIERAVASIYLRGPDGNGIFSRGNILLGHTRLSIIDVSDAASQPFTDVSGRYTIVFNGEFYNFKKYKEQLIKLGYSFKSESDTEVLLTLYIHYGLDFFKTIDGDFAFAIYDSVENSLLLARDRAGVKPLYFYQGEEYFCFSSEMKAMIEMDVPRKIDNSSLHIYFQLNYIPSPYTIFENVFKLNPGEYILIKNKEITRDFYYEIKYQPDSISDIDYTSAQDKLFSLLDNSVQKRLVSDVPLGAFLSGGIDSSIITAIASRHVKNFNTFTIGFKDEPFFDETQYAKLVADKFNTNHTVFSLSNDDLYSVLFSMLEYFDEPFADSSALAVNILAKHTRQNVTVALSGDGADELFSGYNKHHAHLKAINGGFLNEMIKTAYPVLKCFRGSRNSGTGNLMRQMLRFSEGLKLDAKERYWRWCSLGTDTFTSNLLIKGVDTNDLKSKKNHYLQNIKSVDDFNEILLADMKLVLPGDMLVKADLMTMANSLEVRVPFLDHEIIDFIFSLPAHYKIDKFQRKKILKDTFRNILPQELYTRPKHGFEVPLLKWFRGDLKSLILDDLLEKKFIIEQGIFRYEEIEKLKNRLFSGNPGDVHANIWALIVFQYWWKKFMMA